MAVHHPDTTYVVTDCLGRRWDCKITMAGARRIDAADYSAIIDRDFSILDADKQLLGEILTNKGLLMAMFWFVVRPQAAGNGIFIEGLNLAEEGTLLTEDAAQEAFMEGFDGDKLEEASEKFWRALGDFFPERRIVLSQLVDRVKSARMKLDKEIEEMGPEITDAIEADIDQRIKEGRERLLRELRGETTAGGK